MKKPSTQSAGFTQRLRQLGLTALLAGGATVAAHAQNLNYTVAGATNITTTYTDLGTNGTAITTANNDDANSAVQNIGFTFTYNGTSFTQFFLNTNGFIKLGATAPSATAMYPAESAGTGATEVFQSAADPNIIAPFNFDLAAGSAGNTEYRVYTSGTAGSRICTIQWKNVSDKTGTYLNQLGNVSFQVRLYEATGVIEFVYGTATAGTNPDDYRFAEIGLKGTSFASGRIVQALNAPTSPWSGATFADFSYVVANNTLVPFSFRKNLLPDAGRTFRFTPVAPAPANDAAVATIYTLGKLATPASLPHTVQARVTNAGSAALTNLTVTLSVTGANAFSNTQTVASLAVGASTTVTFAAYPSTLTVGTNNITVSVPADGNAANNSATYTQQVTNNRLLVADPALTNTSALSYSSANTGGVLASKFTAATATRLTDVIFYFGATNATTSVQAVVYDATGTGGTPGTLLYTSAAQNRPAAGGPVTITLPNVQVPTSYFIGIKEAGAGGAGLFVQPESPLRTGTFYASANGSTSWTDLSATTQQVRLLIESGFSAILATTSPELMRAVTVYPNPSATGVFNLAINGANAQKGLEVEVVNTLGQRVYAGSARDNFTTQLDLSNLANGLYHLKVKNGEEYMQRQLSIVK
jgi:hypothetical protein